MYSQYDEGRRGHLTTALWNRLSNPFQYVFVSKIAGIINNALIRNVTSACYSYYFVKRDMRIIIQDLSITAYHAHGPLLHLAVSNNVECHEVISAIDTLCTIIGEMWCERVQAALQWHIGR